MRMLRSLALALTALALTAGVAIAAPPDPFRGSWSSTDNVDSSSQWLVFGGSRDTRAIRLVDLDATVACGGGLVTGTATGEISGESITGTLHLTCANGNEPVGQDISVTWTYDEGDNTLTDSLGDTWHRP